MLKDKFDDWFLSLIEFAGGGCNRHPNVSTLFPISAVALGEFLSNLVVCVGVFAAFTKSALPRFILLRKRRFLLSPLEVGWTVINQAAINVDYSRQRVWTFRKESEGYQKV